MSTAEKTEQLYGLRGKYFGQPINQRLGILGYEQADGPHGINWTPSTVFPVGIAAMATWDPEYMQVVGRAMAKEFRAHGRNQMLGPTLDLNRDPRYGRSPESGGEDPYLSGKVNAGIVRGAQAYGMVATAKHFVKTNKESNKDNENNTMNDRTLMDLYVKPFQIVIEDSNVFSIMNAYGKVNGPTCSESSKLQTEILRNRLGFKYFIVSDWNEVENTAASINAGNDICMGSDHYMDQLLNNVNGGQVSMATLNEAVRRALRAKVDSGIIDGLPPGNGSDLNSDANRDVALVEAQKSIVLLKNTGGILPLKANADSIALIGPNVKGTALDGRGSSWIDPTNLVTPFQGFTNKANGVTLNYAKGCDVNSTDTSGFAEALTVARNSKTVVFIGGLEKYQEGENGEGVYDRTVDSVTNQKSFQLPGRQQELINQLAAANPNIVVVIMSGGTCGVNRCVSNIKGLLYAYYPGIRGGDAIADIVFGNVNPSGKLPVTMAKNESQLPDWNKTDYSGDEIDGFGYRRFDKMGWTPEFAFGFGLSYTTFSYSNIKATSTSPGSGTVTVTADITNTGTVAGDEVAQLYLSHTSASVPMPVKQLAGFKRVSLAPGEKKTVTFSLTPNELSYWSMARNHFLVEAGSYTVKVGGSSDNLPLSATFTISSEFEIPYGGLK
jgi:beta-glucosidase